MKDSLRSKLETLTRRMDELNAMLSSEDATHDLDRYRALTKEYPRELGPVVARYREFQQAEADLVAAQEMSARSGDEGVRGGGGDGGLGRA